METVLEKNGDLGDGNHFLTLLGAETARMKGLVCAAEQELEEDETIPEDVRGKLRVGVGKAKMLLRKKFMQFEGLCYNNLGVKSDVRYPVTPEDLAGFWDTILLQILQVYKIFEEVDILRKNNWEEPKTSSNKVGKLKRKVQDVQINDELGKQEIQTKL